MNLRSIGVKLTIWYVGLLGATFLILGGAAYALLTYNLQREIDVSLNSVASTLAERATEGAESIDPVDEIFRRYFGFIPLNPYFEMLDPTGKGPTTSQRDQGLMLTQKALDNANKGLSTFETIKPSTQYPIRILTKPVIVDNRVVNLVQTGVSLERTYQTRKQFLLMLIAMMPIGVALAGGGGWLLARRSLKPIQVMTEAARRINAYQLSDRIEESGTGDELDQLARTLNETLERLDGSFDQIRQFSADASHELQTPLTVLKGEIEVALRHPRSHDEYRETLQSGLEEVDRLAKLVEGLLLLARADSGVLKIEQKSLDLGELSNEVIEELSQFASKQGIKLTSDTKKSVHLQGDFILLRQLVQNLVQNGIKYTPMGGSVDVEVSSNQDQVILKVSDTGEGIDPEDQKNIFERFFRATESRSEMGGGSGLGLSIVKSIVDAHKGEIELFSEPGNGSTFIVRLPR